MPELAEACCNLCAEPLERVRYFPRQLLTADDMRAEQEYMRQRMRRHNRFVHGWGIVCGAMVEAAPAAGKPWQVRVCPGYLLSPQGDDILIDDCVLFDVKTGAGLPQPCAPRWPCPPEGDMPRRDDDSFLYLAARYAECKTRPVRVPAAGCGCDETDCEYSRVRDSFELKVLWKLPESHVNIKKADAAWCETLKKSGTLIRRQRVYPTPDCPQCETDPWIVLATIRLPQKDKDIAAGDIFETDRNVLLSTRALQVAVVCLP